MIALVELGHTDTDTEFYSTLAAEQPNS